MRFGVRGMISGTSLREKADRFDDLPAGVSVRDYAKQTLISNLKALAPDMVGPRWMC